MIDFKVEMCIRDSAKDLKEYLNRIEEAKRRDHRKLGKELDLFAFHEDVAAGMVFWLPKGMLLRTILEDCLLYTSRCV